MSETIFQLKITLKGSKPSIWRRILVEDNTLLSDLHKIIQTTMGWTNSHLHQFEHQGKFYSQPSEWDEIDILDYTNIKISQLLKKKNDAIIYEYDFGDSWKHDVVIEQILEKEKGKKYPVCIEGKNACPPEDCGGVWGYSELIKTISNPKSKNYKEMIDWLGKEFDPNEFNEEEINNALGSEDFGVISIWDFD